MADDRFEGTGGLGIYFRSWKPAGAPRAVVTIVHGFNSHSGHYLWVAQQMVERGLAVYALDLRGRGKSDGERYYVQAFAEYVSDVHRMVQIAKTRTPNVPAFLFGHSAGGVIACNYVLDHPDEVDGLICESFAYKVYAPSFALAVLKGLSHVAPHAHVLKLRNKHFSRDPAVVGGLEDDPLIAHEVQPTNTVAEMVRADERLTRDFSSISLPLLIMHGTGDRVTRAAGSQAFYAAAGSDDKTLELYEGFFHDLLNDVDREKPMRDVLDWIDQRI